MDAEQPGEGAGGGRGRRRRRAVGPPGARPVHDEPLLAEPEREPAPGDDDRLLADRPPHHDRGV